MTHDDPLRPELTEDGRWLIIDGQRWRRTDPALADEVVDELKSHLGRARSDVGRATTDTDRADARRRVGIAKRGLGERGPYWWDRPADERRAQARSALDDLRDTSGEGAPAPR